MNAVICVEHKACQLKLSALSGMTLYHTHRHTLTHSSLCASSNAEISLTITILPVNQSSVNVGQHKQYKDRLKSRIQPSITLFFKVLDVVVLSPLWHIKMAGIEKISLEKCKGQLSTIRNKWQLQGMQPYICLAPVDRFTLTCISLLALLGHFNELLIDVFIGRLRKSSCVTVIQHYPSRVSLQTFLLPRCKRMWCIFAVHACVCKNVYLPSGESWSLYTKCLCSDISSVGTDGGTVGCLQCKLQVL